MALKEFDVPVERRIFPASQGLELVGDAFGDAAHPPALLFHGGGQTRHSWSGTAERLAQSSLRVLVINDIDVHSNKARLDEFCDRYVSAQFFASSRTATAAKNINGIAAPKFGR